MSVFNRRMFNRGGYVHRGTGITSGLTPVQRFDNGGEANRTISKLLRLFKVLDGDIVKFFKLLKEKFGFSDEEAQNIEVYIQELEQKDSLNIKIHESLELEIWDAISGVKSALRGDAALSGNCTDSRPGFATTGYIDLSGVTFKVASIPFFVEIYGSETITP